MDQGSWQRRSVLEGIVGASVVGTVAGRAGAAPPVVVPDDHATIQGAVDAADPGGTVVVDGGTYREQVIVRKDLTVRGRDDPTLLPPDGSLGVGDVAVVQPVFGAVGYGNDVTFEGFTVDGEFATDKGGFYSCVGYYEADGTVRDVTATGADYGGYITQNRGGGGDQTVSVVDSHFEDLGLGRGRIGETQLVFNEPGTTGRVEGSTFVGTPDEYTYVYGLSIGYGASVDVRGNVFRDFYTAGGYGIGTYAFNAANCGVQRNAFESVQYPFYATASSRANASADRSRVMHNTFDGSGLPEGLASTGTTLYAYDTDGDDGRVESVNNVKVIHNDYTGFDVGVASFTSGEGVVQRTKVVRNDFEDVGTPVADNGTGTVRQANRVE